MKSFVYHLQLNVTQAERSLPFYRELLGYLGYTSIDEGADYLGMSNGTADLWLIESELEHRANGFHRKNPGINHLAFGVGSRGAVDQFASGFLAPRAIRPLYDSPREFPEYRPGYYAVFFEDPDRVKLEIVYIPGFEARFSI